MEIYLVDQNEEMITAWEGQFRDDSGVNIFYGEYFDFQAEAMVAPSNSQGTMEGGLNEQICEEIWEGEVPEIEALHVGEARSIRGNDEWPFVIIAPTMEEPGDVSYSDNAFSAFLAILEEADKTNVDSLLCCGLATGVGRMLPEESAAQMKMAFDQYFNSKNNTLHT
jgi:O-acetyl-ADP-ribose deacetylase (regulator of RNase III)